MDEVTRTLSLVNERKNLFMDRSFLRCFKSQNKHHNKNQGRFKQRQLAFSQMFPKSIEEENESIVVALSLSMQDQDKQATKAPSFLINSQICSILLPDEAQLISTTHLLTVLEVSQGALDIRKFKHP